MRLRDFLEHLGKENFAAVDSGAELEGDDSWLEIVLGWEKIQRLELAFTAPRFSPAVAEWAAVRLYRGCQALVCRDMPPADVHRYLSEACPEPRSPRSDYSADLLFRFLPGLLAFARRLAREDPLVEELLVLARAWPLSSIGIDGLGETDPASFIEDPSLRQLYVDRILAAGDTTRLHHDAVRQAVQTALGAYPEMAPSIASCLTTTP
jgi:hypothetical protein